MYVYFSSLDCKSDFPLNRGDSFRLELPHLIGYERNTGVQCALCEIHFDQEPLTNIVITSSVVEASYIRGDLRPVLRVCAGTEWFVKRCYIPLKRERLRYIDLEILNFSDLNPINIEGEVWGVLHFADQHARV